MFKNFNHPKPIYITFDAIINEVNNNLFQFLWLTNKLVFIDNFYR